MTKTFRAAVLTCLNQPLELLNLKFPDLYEGQVLVKILYSTICGSQLFEIAGDRGTDSYIPHLLGHEGYGIVEEVGNGVSRFKSGDKVILTWINQLGLDCKGISFEADSGQRISAGKVTTFSEYAVVAENKLYKAPELKDPKIMPLLGCAALTGGGMVFNNKIDCNRTLVLGGGGVGIFTILALLFLGTEEIHVVEKSEQKQNLISRIDSRIFLHPDINSDSLIKEIASRGAFKEVFECTGSISTLQAGIEMTSMQGCLTFCSHPKYGDNLIINPFDLIRGKRVFGSWGGGCEDEKIRNKAIDVVRIYREFISLMMRDSYSLDSINEALENARSGRNFKVLIDMTDKK